MTLLPQILHSSPLTIYYSLGFYLIVRVHFGENQGNCAKNKEEVPNDCSALGNVKEALKYCRREKNRVGGNIV